MCAQSSALRATREMFKHAIQDTAIQLEVQSPSRAVDLLRRGDCNQCDILRHNLAREVGGYLATVDRDLRAVYMYDPDSACGAYEGFHRGSSPSSSIHLIAWTRTQKSLSTRMLQELRQAFDQARREVLCAQATALCYGLNLTVVNDAQVRARQGYAAMIDSLSARPLRVWAKTAHRRGASGKSK